MPQPLRLLHLSDLHVRTRTAWDHEPVLRHLAEFIAAEVAAGLAPDLVVITGDLAFSGQAQEYHLAGAWLRDVLWPVLSGDTAKPLPHDRLLLVPGNHDVDRGQVDRVAGFTQDGLRAAADQTAIADLLDDPRQRDTLLKGG